jgi:hypothetical protein
MILTLCVGVLFFSLCFFSFGSYLMGFSYFFSWCSASSVPTDLLLLASSSATASTKRELGLCLLLRVLSYPPVHHRHHLHLNGSKTKKGGIVY